MYSNEEATDIVSSIRRETIFIYPVMNSLKSCNQYNSLMERLVSHVRLILPSNSGHAAK